MSAGSVTARFLRTGMPVRLDWADGVITRVQPADESPELEHRWLAPPLVVDEGDVDTALALLDGILGELD